MIPAIIILAVIVSTGSVTLFLFSGKKRQNESNDFRADDGMLALARNLNPAPLVQRRRFESRESYRIRLTRAENEKMIEGIDESLERANESLERINENAREIKRMLSEM